MSPVTPTPPRSRDVALDVLRGWAIVLMVLSHVGNHSHLTTLVHLPLWISAADPFVALAGFVLGMRARAGAKGGHGRRAYRFWAIHCPLMLLVVVVHELTGRFHVPPVSELGGFLRTAWMVLTLRLQSSDFMNILPLFIVFFALAPGAIMALDAGFGVPLALASFALWAYAQTRPGWLRFTDPRSGPEAFVLGAWQLAFFLPLVLGYHREALGRFLSQRRWPLALLGALTVAIFVVAQLQRHALARLGLVLPASVDWLVAKESLGPVRVVYDLGLMTLGYLWVDGRWRRAATPGRGIALLAMLGRKSLYAFLIHLPVALLAVFFGIDGWPMWAHDVAAVFIVTFVFVMAKYDVAARFVPT